VRALDLPTMPHLTAATKNLCARGASQIEDVERKVAFLVICASIYLSGFLHTFLIPLVPSYHLITGAYFSTAEVSMLFASYSLGAAIGTPLTLFLAGHVKCWMMIATAQVVFFFNCIMFMAGSSFPILFLSRTIGGVGATFLLSGAIAMLDSLYPASERGNRLVMVYFCGGFGLTTGPLIGGSLSGDGAFIPCLLAALALAGCFALLVMHLRDNDAEFTKMEPLSPHVKDPQTTLSLASLVLVSATVAFSEVILPLHLNVAFATTASALGGLLMIAAIAYIFVANVAALVSEKINRNVMLGGGLAVNGVAFLALFSPESLAMEVVPVMLLGCSASVVYTGAFMRMVDSVGQGDARSPALQQLAFAAHNLGAFLGPAVLGASVHLFGLEAAAYTYGTLAIAAGVAIGWIAKKKASLDDEPTLNASALVDFQLLFTL
jgi:DHA1 family multidrug resistance protein-like MFS transporter